jgi:Ca-activated chloride channel family protein
MRVSAALAACALLAAGERPAQHTPTFRADAKGVALYATVQDGEGRLVTGLERGEFEVRDNGRPVAITQFSNAIQPITMVLLVDMSGSMAHRYRQARDAMLELVEALLPEDRVRLGTFGGRILFTPWLTSDKEILRRLLHYELHPGGDTPLWLAMSTSMLSLDGERGRRVVLTVTDGRDSCRGRGCVQFDEVEAKALANEMMVYAIGMAGTALDRDIRRLAERTGGGHFELPHDADMRRAFQRVAEELHQQYLIGFTPSVLDGRRHTIDVRLRAKGLTARTRKDYLAS